MSEILVLDPPEVSYNRAALDITAFVAEQGPDFGEAAIEQFLAEGYRGQLPVDFKVPNRTIAIPLVLRDVTGRTFDQMREFVQAKAALFQREGGWFKRQLPGGVVYADVVGATLHYGGSTMSAIDGVDPDAVLTLECIPDFYGDEIGLGEHAETALPELTFTETGVKGDYPARVRLVVDEDQGVNQHGLLWGMRCQHYSPDSTARLAYRATVLTPLDAAVNSSAAGAIVHSAVGKSWTPVLSTTLGGNDLTHTGTYRVFARIGTGGGGGIPTVQARFVWDVGDLTNPTENRPWVLPTNGSYFIADLGEIRIDAAQAGTHKWVGHVEVRAMTDGTGTAVFSIADLWFQPVDDGCGAMAAVNSTSTFSSFVSRDEFTGSGVLVSRTMPVGGTWTTAGDTDDWTVTSGGAVRTATADASAWLGRYGIAGNNPLAASSVRLVFLHQALTNAGSGVFLRYTDINNWVMGIVTAWNAALTQFQVFKRVAGTVTQIGGLDGPYALATNGSYGLELVCETDGSFALNFGVAGQTMYPYVRGNDSALATGGALATGKQGMYDVNTSATANTRIYDYFGVNLPSTDAVLFANQSAELTYSGIYRQAITGNSYGPVSHVSGDLPRLPPAGLEARPVEVFVKATRGDLDQLPDSYLVGLASSLVADDISARLFYRPSWLFVPESGTGSVTPTGLFPATDLYPAPDLFPEL